MTRESSTLTLMPSAETCTCAREMNPTQRRMVYSCRAELVTALRHGRPAGAGGAVPPSDILTLTCRYQGCETGLVVLRMEWPWLWGCRGDGGSGGVVVEWCGGGGVVGM